MSTRRSALFPAHKFIPDNITPFCEKEITPKRVNLSFQVLLYPADSAMMKGNDITGSDIFTIHPADDQSLLHIIEPYLETFLVDIKLLRYFFSCHRGWYFKQYLCFFGQYILTPDLFQYIKYLIDKDIRERGEIQLTSALEMARKELGVFYAYEIDGHRYDTGVPISYANTVHAFAARTFAKLSR